MLFPSARNDSSAAHPRTAIALTPVEDALPVVSWVGSTVGAASMTPTVSWC